MDVRGSTNLTAAGGPRRCLIAGPNIAENGELLVPQTDTSDQEGKVTCWFWKRLKFAEPLISLLRA